MRAIDAIPVKIAESAVFCHREQFGLKTKGSLSLLPPVQVRSPDATGKKWRTA